MPMIVKAAGGEKKININLLPREEAIDRRQDPEWLIINLLESIRDCLVIVIESTVLSWQQDEIKARSL